MESKHDLCLTGLDYVIFWNMISSNILKKLCNPPKSSYDAMLFTFSVKITSHFSNSKLLKAIHSKLWLMKIVIGPFRGHIS